MTPDQSPFRGEHEPKHQSSPTDPAFNERLDQWFLQRATQGIRLRWGSPPHTFPHLPTHIYPTREEASGSDSHPFVNHNDSEQAPDQEAA